ncbi:unnamed protein product [Ilex paraguariensis]|uniref:Knottins-like domain-containing protein n=1 Tax=Ilex paraguariensis TaxID=185542 RepID=A0ABC8R9U1_9AQUA
MAEWLKEEERPTVRDGFERGSLNEMGPMKAEAKLCEYKSERFWNPCFSDINCANTCIKEKFNGGHCNGLRRRCYCYKPCT